MNGAVTTAFLLFNACYPTQAMIWNFIKMPRNSNLRHFSRYSQSVYAD